MKSFSGFNGGRKQQGGWVTGAAIFASAALNYSAMDSASDAASRASGRSNDIAERELELALRQDERAAQLFDRYMEVYAPLEDELIENIDQGLDTKEIMGRTTADVRTAHGLADATRKRNLSRYGINPADGRYEGSERRAGLALAKDTVSAREGARRYVDEEKFRRRGTVAALGRNLPSASAGFTSQAMGGLSNVGNRYTNQANNFNNLAGQAGQGLGQSLMMLGTWGSQQGWGSGGGGSTPAVDMSTVPTDSVSLYG